MNNEGDSFKSGLITFFLIFCLMAVVPIRPESPFLTLLLSVGVVHVFGGFLSIFNAFKSYKGKLAELLQISKPKKNFIIDVISGVGLCYMALIFGVMLMLPILNFIGMEPEPHAFGEISQSFTSPIQWIIAIILVGVLGPFVEEVIFRRFLYGFLLSQIDNVTKRNRLEAILIASALFSVIHFVPVALISYFLIAIVLQRSMNHHKNLLYPFAIHVTYNASLILLTCFFRSIGHV